MSYLNPGASYLKLWEALWNYLKLGATLWNYLKLGATLWNYLKLGATLSRKRQKTRMRKSRVDTAYTWRRRMQTWHR